MDVAYQDQDGDMVALTANSRELPRSRPPAIPHNRGPTLNHPARASWGTRLRSINSHK